jgi:hypothetical protein
LTVHSVWEDEGSQDWQEFAGLTSPELTQAPSIKHDDASIGFEQTPLASQRSAVQSSPSLHVPLSTAPSQSLSAPSHTSALGVAAVQVVSPSASQLRVPGQEPYELETEQVVSIPCPAQESLHSQDVPPSGTH